MELKGNWMGNKEIWFQSELSCSINWVTLEKSIKFSMCRVLIWMEIVNEILIYNLGMQFSVQWTHSWFSSTFSWIKRIFGEHFHFMMYKGSFFFSSLFYVFLSSHISLLMLYLLNNLSVLLGEMQSWPCKNKMYLHSEPAGSERLTYGSVFRLKPRHVQDWSWYRILRMKLGRRESIQSLFEC